EPVGDPVGERRDREAPVAAGGADADRVLLQDHDVAVWGVAFRVQRGPEAGEAAADDAEVGARRAGERGGRVAAREGGEPVGDRRGVGVGGALLLGRRRVRPGKAHGQTRSGSGMLVGGSTASTTKPSSCVVSKYA